MKDTPTTKLSIQLPFQIIDIYSAEKKLILTAIDKFTKLAQAKSRSIEDIKRPLGDLLFFFSVPEVVVIDNEKSLNSASITSMMEDELKIKIFKTPPYKSEVNGQIERFHSTLSEIMRCLKADGVVRTFEELLERSINEYNFSIHSTTGKKPVEVFYGRNPNIVPVDFEKTRLNNIEKLKQKQQKDIKNHNKNRQPIKTYEPGQTIYVKHNKRLGSKLTVRYKSEIVKEDKNTVIITESGKTVHKSFLDADKPYFDDVNPRNVTTVVDETAILKCRVKNKGNRTLSWMRKRDLHILTTNIYTYTGDQRFSVVHTPGSDDWDLKIEYAQQRDSGIYECQVNTEPKINLAVRLEVTAEPDPRDKYSEPHIYDIKAARAKILGSQEVHVKRDSTISLSCSVNIHASSVLWYHGSSIVDFDSVRGGISLETEKTDVGTTSRLMLTRASLRDSGNYTCVPAAAIPASVQVHVLNGEHPAAMQTSSGVPRPSHLAIIILCIFSITACHQPIISQTTSILLYSIKR